MRNVGDVVRIYRYFYSPLGDLSDPATVELDVTSPDGTTTTYTLDDSVERNGVGDYDVLVTVDEPGFWTYRWRTTGTPTLQEPGSFWVDL